MNNRLFRLFVAGGLATSGLVAGGSILGGSAGGASTVSIPAPPAVGTASGLRLGNLVSIATSATGAGSSGASAAAVPVSILGHTVVGGSQVGPGQQSGALIDTGTTPLGRVQVAPWAVAVTQAQSSRTASATSAAAHVDVISPNVVQIDVLKSSSNSTHTGALSVGQAVSDGAIVRVGGPNGVIIHVLHSEADSGGHGRTYLVAVGNVALLDNSTVGAICSAVVPQLLQLTCLNVAGGIGGLTASDLQAVINTLPGVPSFSAGAITSAVTGGTAQPASATPAGIHATLPSEDSLPASTPAKAVVHATRGLAFTGFAIRFALVAASLLIALGSMVLAAARRRTATAS